MLAIFQCVALAVREKGVRGLNEFVPGASYVVDIAGRAYALWSERRKAAKLRDELAKVAAASADEAKKVAEQVAREVMHDAPAEDRAALELYLTQLPGAARESLAQSDLADEAESLAWALPLDAPRFSPEFERALRAAQSPLEGGSAPHTFLLTPIAAEPEPWQVPLRGEWFARASADAPWALTSARLPGEVVVRPGELYRLAIHPDSTDAELAQLRALAGLPGLEAVDLSGCASVTDAGLMHLADLRGVKAVALGDTQVTDAGIELLLTRFPDLEAVSLAGAAGLTDAIVPHLLKLRKLKSLSLPPRADTPATRADFAKRRPACQVG